MAPPPLKPTAAALAIFAALMIVYVLTLAPAVTAEDSGELATAMQVGGVPHPPGFPTWCLLTRAGSELASLFAGEGSAGLASPVYRANLMSAIYAALSCVALFYLLRRLTGSLTAAAAAAAMMGLGTTFWSQAVIAEVYSLNVLFMLVTLHLMLSWRETASRRALYAGCVVFGLSLGNHWPLAALAAIPFVAWLVLGSSRREILGGARRAAWPLVALALAAAVPYLYMYLRARTDPAINWGDPSTLGRLFDHVSRSGYSDLESDASTSLQDKVLYLGQFLGLALWQFTPLVLVPLAVGARALYRERRELLLLVALMLLFNPVLLLGALHFKFVPGHWTRPVEYYLPAYALLALVTGFGLHRIIALFPRRAVLAGVLVSALFPAAALVANWSENDRSETFIAADYAAAVLEAVGEGAILFPSEDKVSFPVMYLQAVEGRRPDVLLANPYGLGMTDEVLELFVAGGKLSELAERELRGANITTEIAALAELHRRFNRALDPVLKQRAILVYHSIAASLVEHSGRPVYFGGRVKVPFWSVINRHDPKNPYFRVAPRGLLVQPLPPGVTEEVGADRIRRDWEALDRSLRNVHGTPEELDEASRRLAFNYHLKRGEMLARARDREGALGAFERAAEFAMDDRSFNNLGGMAATYGFLDQAERYSLDALRFSHRHILARENLIMLYRYRAGKAGSADEQMEHQRLGRHHDRERRGLTVLEPRSPGDRAAAAAPAKP